MLEAAVDKSVDHDSPSEYAKLLRDIVFRTHLDVLHRGVVCDPSERVGPMAVRRCKGVVGEAPTRM